jgi:hypothetical protein
LKRLLVVHTTTFRPECTGKRLYHNRDGFQRLIGLMTRSAGVLRSGSFAVTGVTAGFQESCGAAMSL